MRHRYEVWHYSQSWDKWVRDIYRNLEEAQQRYDSLRRKGKSARAPRLYKMHIPLFERVGFVFSEVLRRRNPSADASRLRHDRMC
jgi:hypothetical protein